MEGQAHDRTGSIHHKVGTLWIQPSSIQIPGTDIGFLCAPVAIIQPDEEKATPYCAWCTTIPAHAELWYIPVIIYMCAASWPEGKMRSRDCEVAELLCMLVHTQNVQRLNKVPARKSHTPFPSSRSINHPDAGNSHKSTCRKFLWTQQTKVLLICKQADLQGRFPQTRTWRTRIWEKTAVPLLSLLPPSDSIIVSLPNCNLCRQEKNTPKTLTAATCPQHRPKHLHAYPQQPAGTAHILKVKASTRKVLWGDMWGAVQTHEGNDGKCW